ncbi:MAG: beta-ketoacyl synthase N-terminal-like domain-containing protein, partial [Huintestinicola sp.]
MRRVVVTGMGVVSPLGNSLEEFWSNIKANKLGFSFLDDMVSEDFEVRIGAPVKDFSIEKYVDKKEAKRLDRFTQFAVYAALEAMADAGTDFKDIDPYRAGVIAGVGIGGLDLTMQEYAKYMEKG